MSENHTLLLTVSMHNDSYLSTSICRDQSLLAIAETSRMRQKMFDKQKILRKEVVISKGQFHDI